jgi:hypothetical protein
MTPFPGAETVLRSALAARTFSAFAAEIGNTDGPVWTVAGGTLGFETHTAVDATTIFDLASREWRVRSPNGPRLTAPT